MSCPFVRCSVYLFSVTAPSAHASQPRRPPPPPFRLPPSKRRPGGAVASFLLHSLIVMLFVRHGVQWLLGGGGEAGPRGGGGGGSSVTVRYVQVPAASASEHATVSTAPAVPDVPLPVPEPVELDVPPPETAPLISVAPVAAATSTTGDVGGGGPGTGPGTGGGTGAGTGPGAGNDSGSGRGGDAEYIFPPYARTVLLPADCARGRFTVRFWVEDDGRVARVAVEPPPKNAGCRREMLDKMMGYQFLPARTRDGRAVASVYEVRLAH